MVVAEPGRVGERHGRDGGVTEPVEVVADGDQVLLARQSHQVPMEDEEHRPATMVGQVPRSAEMVGQAEAADRVADPQPPARGRGPLRAAHRRRPRPGTNRGVAAA